MAHDERAVWAARELRDVAMVQSPVALRLAQLADELDPVPADDDEPF